jgi:hypothetical protein
MAPENKLAFLEKFNFSKTGQFKRMTITYYGPKIKLYHDIVRMVQVLKGSLKSFLEKSHIRLIGKADSKEYKNIEKQIQDIGKVM